MALKPGKRHALAPDSAASVRTRVEHPFLYLKRHFGYARVHYRGLARQRIVLLPGFANLMIGERHLALA